MCVNTSNSKGSSRWYRLPGDYWFCVLNGPLKCEGCTIHSRDGWATLSVHAPLLSDDPGTTDAISLLAGRDGVGLGAEACGAEHLQMRSSGGQDLCA